jgi:hypothetical protein
MIDALIKHVSVTYKCYEMYAIGEKRCNCSFFEIAILLIIGINYGVCRIVIKSVQKCTYFLFSLNRSFFRKSYQCKKPNHLNCCTCPLFSILISWCRWRTFHNIYKLQKHVLLRHQSYLIVFIGNKNLRFWQIMPL